MLPPKQTKNKAINGLHIRRMRDMYTSSTAQGGGGSFRIGNL